MKPTTTAALAAQMRAYRLKGRGTMNRQVNDIDYIWRPRTVDVPAHWDGGARGGVIRPHNAAFVAISEGGKASVHATFDFAAGVAQYRNAERLKAYLAFIEAYALARPGA